MASSSGSDEFEPDVARMVDQASMGNKGRVFLQRAVENAEVLHSLLGGERHAALPPGATDDAQAALAHVVYLLSVYAKAAGKSATSKLLTAAAPLTAVSAWQATVVCLSPICSAG